MPKLLGTSLLVPPKEKENARDAAAVVSCLQDTPSTTKTTYATLIMSSKRKFSDFKSEPSADGETREYAPSHQNSKNKKKNGPSKEKPTSISWVKKRARTIERRLNHKDSLPANVKHDLEKELDHHKQKLDDFADSRKRQSMIKKYHMVRFFGEWPPGLDWIGLDYLGFA